MGVPKMDGLSGKIPSRNGWFRATPWLRKPPYPLSSPSKTQRQTQSCSFCAARNSVVRSSGQDKPGQAWLVETIPKLEDKKKMGVYHKKGGIQWGKRWENRGIGMVLGYSIFWQLQIITLSLKMHQNVMNHTICFNKRLKPPQVWFIAFWCTSWYASTVGFIQVLPSHIPFFPRRSGKNQNCTPRSWSAQVRCYTYLLHLRCHIQDLNKSEGKNWRRFP